MPVTAPADKRFLRAHVRPVRRRPLLPAVVGLVRVGVIAAVLLGGVYRMAAGLMTSPRLRIERVTVSGTDRVPRREVLAMLDELRGQNILRADLEAARARLVASPWIADAVLRKRLPSSVDVSVVERRPMAIGRLDGRLFLVDETGTIIDQYGPRYAELDLPVVDGLKPAGAASVDPSRVDLASRLLASLAVHPDTARRISQIDVSDAGDAVVLLDTDAALLRLGDRDFRERIEGYLDMAPALRERVASIDYVDLRYGNRVFVGTSGKAAAAGAQGVKR